MGAVEFTILEAKRFCQSNQLSEKDKDFSNQNMIDFGWLSPPRITQ